MDWIDSLLFWVYSTFIAMSFLTAWRYIGQYIRYRVDHTTGAMLALGIVLVALGSGGEQAWWMVWRYFDTVGEAELARWFISMKRVLMLLMLLPIVGYVLHERTYQRSKDRPKRWIWTSATCGAIGLAVSVAATISVRA